MILTKDQLVKEQMLTEDGIYDYRLTQQRFSYKLFKNNVSPYGDIICFKSPSIIGSLGLKDSFVVAGELPNTNIFGGACFLRLYATQLGSLLSMITNKESYVDESSIFIENKQASLSMINQVKDSIVFHIVFPIDTDQDVFYKFSLIDNDLNAFETNVIESFKHLTKSIFVETRRDNI
jgi:hypothetical protein